jgi:hypothetical protein
MERSRKEFFMTDRGPSTPWYHKPIWLGLVALALMLGGWKLSTHVSLTPHQADQADKFAEVRAMAKGQFREELDRMAGNVQPTPPFRWAGRLVFMAGAGLFVVAAVLMFRKPAAQAAPADEVGVAADDPDADLREP